MTIRTLEQLSDYLDSELAWRKKELASLKALIDQSSSAGSRRETLLRSGVAILYAHWEGFIKSAANAYVEYVSRQQLTYAELTSNFVAVGIRALLTRAAQSKKARDHNELVTFLRTQMSARSSIPFRAAIDARSNLNSAVFRDIVERLGLDYGPYETKENLIDKSLVERRNTVAHGHFMLIDASSFGELLSEVLSIIELFRNQIDNSARSGSFRTKVGS